jgi:hypothetical protein
MATKRRSLSAIELAIAFAIVASFLGIAVPAFFRDLHASKLVEPVDGIKRMAIAVVAYSKSQEKLTSGALPEGATAPPPAELLPANAPLTPPDVPRGVLREDPTGTWDHPTWRTLAFRATREGMPHAFSFAFENQGSKFSAIARGDLDGDGVLSLFEVHGLVVPDAKVEPGMYVEAELE